MPPLLCVRTRTEHAACAAYVDRSVIVVALWYLFFFKRRAAGLFVDAIHCTTILHAHEIEDIIICIYNSLVSNNIKDKVSRDIVVVKISTTYFIYIFYEE